MSEFDDEEVRLQLMCGQEADIREAFAQIDQHLRRPICGWIRSQNCPGISVEELEDLWQSALIDLLKQVRAAKYTGTRKVFSDLCQITTKDAIDRYRRKKARDKLLDAVGRGLEDTETGKRWRETSPAERLEIQRLIRQAVASIPGRKQRLVMEAFVANFPESRDLQKLREFTSALSGTEETKITVKRALQEGRAKVRAVLRSKGYNVDVGGEDDE